MRQGVCVRMSETGLRSVEETRAVRLICFCLARYRNNHLHFGTIYRGFAAAGKLELETRALRAAEVSSGAPHFFGGGPYGNPLNPESRSLRHCEAIIAKRNLHKENIIFSY